ncbi:MAG: glycosyltransferase family 9 protein [Ignavibacteria bacterium]|nr:glycosyltransferase family 9 protein [Ignavibacteria bacterium]
MSLRSALRNFAAMLGLTPLSEIQRILISRTDELGDVILTLPLSVAIRKELPDVHLSFLVRPYISHLVHRIREVDQAFTLPPSEKGTEIFREYKPDAIIFAKPEFRLALEAMRAKVDVRIGSGYRWYSGLFTRWVYDRRKDRGSHEAEFEMNMLGPLIPGPHELVMPELPPMEEAAGEAEAHLRGARIEGPYVIIHPVGKPSVLPYPIEQFAQIGRSLLEARPDISVVITSGHGERPIAEQLKEGIGVEGRTAIIDTLSPNGVSELLRGTSCFVSSASDGAHLAALVRAPVVALFPGTPPNWPQRRAPIGPHVTTLTPEEGEPLPKNSGGSGTNPLNVIARIKPERVVEACLQQLNVTAR